MLRLGHFLTEKIDLGQKLMFAKRDKQDQHRSWQTSVVTAQIDFTKPVPKINFGASKAVYFLLKVTF